MYDRVCQDLKEAMKAKDKDRLEVLRMLKSKLLENKTAKTPLDDEQAVVIAYSKQLKDSLAMFPAGSEQQKKIETELSYLTPYLPTQLTEGEVRKMAEDIIKNSENANFGLVMKQLSPLIKGKFDGKQASDIVKSML